MKEFCYWHIKTNQGIKCSKDMDEIKCPDCPYRIDDIKLDENNKLYIPECQDFEIKRGTKKELIDKLK